MRWNGGEETKLTPGLRSWENFYRNIKLMQVK